MVHFTLNLTILKLEFLISYFKRKKKDKTTYKNVCCNTEVRHFEVQLNLLLENNRQKLFCVFVF